MPEYCRRYEAGKDTAPALKDITHRLSGKLGPKHIKDRQPIWKTSNSENKPSRAQPWKSSLEAGVTGEDFSEEVALKSESERKISEKQKTDRRSNQREMYEG